MSKRHSIAIERSFLLYHSLDDLELGFPIDDGLKRDVDEELLIPSNGSLTIVSAI